VFYYIELWLARCPRFNGQFDSTSTFLSPTLEPVLPVIESCDNFALDLRSGEYTPLFLDLQSPTPIGFLLAQVVELLDSYNRRCLEDQRPFQIFKHCVSFSDHVNKFDARTSALQTVIDEWRREGHFGDVIGGWGQQAYPIYPTPTSISSGTAFTVEYMKIWATRLPSGHLTWLGYLDNSITAGIPYGPTPNEALSKAIKGSLKCSDDAAKAAESAGIVSYLFWPVVTSLEPKAAPLIFAQYFKGLYSTQGAIYIRHCLPVANEQVTLEIYLEKALGKKLDTISLLLIDGTLEKLACSEVKE
ncbi:hypothetical protein FRB95_003527, partial [Tulasnella sp. JGI-2019a]